MKKVGMCLLIGGLFLLAAQMTFAGSVKLGVVGPLTGPVAVGGLQTKYGLELAKDEINSRGGIPGVGEIEFIYEDDKCVPPESGNAVNKLVYRNKVLAVIGSVCSSSTMAGMIVSQKAKTPQITAVSTSPAITQKGNKWIFRSSIADATRAGALAEFAVKKLNKKKVGIIHDADDYGRDGAYAFVDKLKEFNIEPKNRPSTYLAGSVPGNMMPGSLPPSSSVTGVTRFAALAITFLPVSMEPVNMILSIPS